MIVFLKPPLKFRFSSQSRSHWSFTRSKIASKSVMPGNTGDTKHTVLIPASYTCFIASILRSMETAASMSSLNFSSSVLIDHDTVTCPSSFKRSRSLTTRSDFVVIRISAPLPRSCSSSFLVFSNSFSCGLYPSVTEPITTRCPAYFFGFFISGQCLTSRNVPHSSVCPVNLFMKEA